MSDIVSDIIEFNDKAGLLGGEMDTFLETAYILEEGFEGFEAALNGYDEDGSMITKGHKDFVSARDWALGFMNQVLQAFEIRGLELPSEVAEFDKAIDGVVFNIGKLAKMRLTRDQIVRGFAAVHKANMAKLGGPKDEFGKQLKPEGWVGPEDELQAILDEREPVVVDESHSDTGEA